MTTNMRSRQSLLLQLGQYASLYLAAAMGATLSCGDRWPAQIAADSMNATAGTRDGELRVSLRQM
ncbi:hypothetical protein [Beijerinckia sp. L45]|uniref:hypothetical protein n=1 Tax=Beijerinckia sp. L45 TaxID=1641855 RepID=UPI00131BFD21|nr:hypothetical protein [Beijerinckia sp. L45]